MNRWGKGTQKSIKVMVWLAVVGVVCSTVSCMTQVYSELNHNPLSLTTADLKASGLAFTTPSTVTGQEQEKQAVAFVFAETLKQERPDLRVLTLPETLSAVNRAGLAEQYQAMYEEYRDTGIFNRDILASIAQATDVRFIAQLKLAGFRQGNSNRFGVFGLRLVDTKNASLRLFFQIWDARQGTIAWEAVQELNWSEERLSENTITLQTLMQKTARDIAERLP